VRSHWESQGYAVLNALAELLGAWHTLIPVREWAVRGLPDFYGANLARLVGDSGQPAHLEQFCQLPLVNQSRATLLLSAVAKQLDSLSSAMGIPRELASWRAAGVDTAHLTNATRRRTRLPALAKPASRKPTYWLDN
jgi:hypothetical protein